MGREPGYKTIRREWDQLGAGMKALFSALVTRANRADLFRLQIEVAPDESFIVLAHGSAAESTVVSPTTAQSNGIASLINFIDGEDA
jgi:hypothetical protein